MTDTRAKTVEITDNGKKIIKHAIKTVETFDKTFFQTLGNNTLLFNEQLLTLLEQKNKNGS